MKLDDIDGNTIALGAILLGAVLAQLRLVSRKLDILIPALMERSRRRNRRDSSGPQPRRREASPSVSDTWDDEDRTDVHYLCELERERERARRRRGERPPRPGTHHDR